MQPFNRFIVPIFFLCFFVGCHSTNEVSPVVVNKGGAGLFVSGEIRAENQAAFTPFLIDAEGDVGEYSQIFWQANVTTESLGDACLISAFPSHHDTDTPRFGLKFWPTNLERGYWTNKKLVDFFVPGTTFSLGQGVGKVELFLQLPLKGPYDVKASRSSYLADPQGSLTVTGIEDYSYFYGITEGELLEGKLIRCTFSGEIGRYDEVADIANGTTQPFQTDEVVEVENGEVLFFIVYYK